MLKHTTVTDPECCKVSFNTGRSSLIVFRCLKHMNYLPHPDVYQVSRHSRGLQCLQDGTSPGAGIDVKLESQGDKAVLAVRVGFPVLAPWRSPFLAPVSSGFAQTDLFCSTTCTKIQYPWQGFVKYLLTAYREVKTVSSLTQEVHFERKSAREKCL